MSTEQRVLFEGVAVEPETVLPGQTFRTIARIPLNEKIDCYVGIEVTCDSDNSKGTIKYHHPIHGETKQEVPLGKKFSLAVRSDDGRQTGQIEWRQVR